METDFQIFFFYGNRKTILKHFLCNSAIPHTSIATNYTISIYWIWNLMRGNVYLTKCVYSNKPFVNISQLLFFVVVVVVLTICDFFDYRYMYCIQCWNAFNFIISLPFSFLLVLNPWTFHLKNFCFKVLNLFFKLICLQSKIGIHSYLNSPSPCQFCSWDIQ